MTREDVFTLIYAEILLLPVIGIVCDNLFVSIMCATYLIVMIASSVKFWYKVYNVIIKLEKTLLKQ